MYIFVNNNTNFNFLKILSNYTIWDRLSQKTISRYCPFKPASAERDKKLTMIEFRGFSSNWFKNRLCPSTRLSRARIFELLGAHESISRYQFTAWRASTTTLFLLGSYPHRLFKNSSTGYTLRPQQVVFAILMKISA